MLSDIFSSLRRLLRDRNGNFGMMAALMTVPLLIAVTVPIDTVRALSVRTVVQQASDAAALAAATSNLPSKKERSDLADSVFMANISAAELEIAISSNKLKESNSAGGSDADTYTYSVTATIGDGSTILPIGTLFKADVDSIVKTGNQKIDIALVLDNSGSMRERDGTSTTRMQELQTAANSFIDQFAGNNQIKLALVPFDSQVRVNTDVGVGIADNPYDDIECSDFTDPFDIANCEANQATRTITETVTTTPPFTMDCSRLSGAAWYETQWCNAHKTGFNLPTEEQGRWVVDSDRRTECVDWGGWGWGWGSYCRRYDYVYEIDSRVYVSEKTNGRYKIHRYSGTCTSNNDYSRGDWTPCGTVHTFDRTIFDQGEPDPVTETITRNVTAFSDAPKSDKNTDELNFTADGDLLWDGIETYDGCYIDRQQPYDVTGYVMPNSTDDTKYPKAQCADNNLSYVMGLTNQHQTVKNEVSAMKPAGWTNITIGMAWGMEALSQNAPLTGARSDNTTRKIIVLMTDGENTQNRWLNVNVRNGYHTVVDQNRRDQINARTLAACNEAKNDHDVEVYTINLVDADSSLLASCATDPGKSISAVRGGLEDAFRDIATQIKKTYLAG